jgi:uncharacterized protein YdeI (YjbR/CyaY-like superfamily)
MASTDPRVHAYIERQQPFARLILAHVRAAVHRACPKVEETIRWGMPSFNYKGRILCQMAAFKAHAAFGFWRSEGLGREAGQDSAMGQFGRLKSVSDLPDEGELDAMIREAASLIDAGTRASRLPRQVKPELPMPDDLAAALEAHSSAQATYHGFPPSCRREYLEWIMEAKRADTRARRIAQAVEWMGEGKRRNWKYERC